MQEAIRNIVERHRSLFGDRPAVARIHAGFTNALFDINGSFIVKICADKSNEENFMKEAAFYRANKENGLIPRCYYTSADEAGIPFLYEILEKLQGETLYSVWHALSEPQREDVIRQLCGAMRQFHQNKGVPYDWGGRIGGQFLDAYGKTSGFFSGPERALLEKAYARFDALLASGEFVFVHNDLHFDNVFLCGGGIKIIDFERSLYAPRDYELDILRRMAGKPRKFASEENEKYIKPSDYKNIMAYTEKYYPELFRADCLYERLAAYDLVYSLAQYADYPKEDELKGDALSAARIVIGA